MSKKPQKPDSNIENIRTRVKLEEYGVENVKQIFF